MAAPSGSDGDDGTRLQNHLPAWVEALTHWGNLRAASRHESVGRPGASPCRIGSGTSIRYVGIGRAIRQPHLVLACSRHMQRELEAHGIASEPLALPVASPGHAFERKPSRNPHFVFCGRLSVEKGVPLLVRAFARLHAHMPLARLTIVGEGPLRNEVESAVLARGLQDAVTFTGWLDLAGIDQQLETAWALVAPSLWAEPLGMVGPEAVIRSVPVIASSTGGFAETIEDEVSGLLFPNGDELALYRALEQVATARHSRRTCWIPMSSPARRDRSASNGTS